MSFTDIICPNCQTVTPGVLKNPVAFGCAHCGKVSAMDTGEQWKALPSMPRKMEASKIKWMVPGAQIKRKDKVYTLTCRYLHGVDWNHFSNDEHKYFTGTSDQEETYFVAEDGAYFSIEQADSSSKFQLREEIRVTPSHIGKVLSKYPTNSNVPDFSTFSVPDFGTFSLSGFTGQDDEVPDQNTWNYKVIKDGAYFVSVEWKNGMPESEWKAYRLREIGILELERWKLRSPEELAQAVEKTKSLGFFRDLFGIVALLMLMMVVYSYIKSQRSAVFDKSWNFYAPVTGISNVPANGQLDYHSMGVMHVESGKPYEFLCKCSFSETNASADFSVAILKMPEGTPVNTFGAAFFREKGRDNEGDYVESTLSDYFYFKPEQTGDYEIMVLAEEQARDNESHHGTFGVVVRPVLLSRYFLVAFLLFTLAWLIYQWRWEYSAAQANLPFASWLQKMFNH